MMAQKLAGNFSTIYGLFTQGINVSCNANVRMGAVPIHFAAVALLLMLTLTLMLCVNRLVHC